MSDAADSQTASFYATHATELAAAYANAHPTYLAHLKTLLREPGATVLDVGCGTGRDVAELLAEGYDAYGIDPSAAMLAQASAHYGIDQDRLGVGALPDAPAPRHQTYDAVLCAAALQHVSEQQLLDSLYRLRSLVSPSGILLLSVPARYPTDDDSRDRHGRLVHVRPAEQYRFFLERLGMYEVVAYEQDDELGRDDIGWQVMVFSRGADSELRPIEVVESILWDDKKVTTYKFALLRAIANLAVHRPRLARWEGHGRVSIPIDPIIDLWIRYYWPFMQTATQSAITQGQSGAKADMGFRAALTELARLWQEAGGYAAFETDLQRDRLSAEVRRLVGSVRAKVRAAVQQPIRYAGNDRTGHGMFYYNEGRVHLPDSIWRESALLGRWIEDSLVIRWAEFTTQRDPSVAAETVLHRLLQGPTLERNTNRAKRAYEVRLASTGLECAWSGEPIRSMHVDHALPWSLWRSNDLWNLLPVESAVNSEKGARLPSRTRVESRRSSIISSWEILFEAEREVFLTHARSFIGTDLGTANARDFGRTMQGELFAAFKDALEYTAVNRGVARW